MLGSYIAGRLNLDRELNYNGDKYLDHSKGKWRRKAYHLTLEEVKYVVNATENNKQAAKLLGIRPETWKKYAKMYVDHVTGKTYYELHKNQEHYKSGLGIGKSSISIQEVIEGKKHYYTKEKLQYMLIAEGYMEECCHICKFNERRLSDYKIPLMLMWKDGNKHNCKLENMELVCFNHAYLYYNKTAPNMSLQNRDRNIPTWHYLLKEYLDKKEGK